jgi:lipid-A-disaccharide synthase
MRIAMIAGEISGDILGAGLMRSLQVRYPHAQFEGIGGARMLALGFRSYYPLSMLSVMGLVEVIRHYPRLKRCHSELCRRFLASRPDVFIGIDAPDFNLPLAMRLRAAAIPTVHYVSPSIWAWRAQRLNTIARACDLMLTLLPFEAPYYEARQIPVCYVGHPLVTEIAPDLDQNSARQRLGIEGDAPLIALLPGSRHSEVTRLGTVFAATAHWLVQRRPQLRFVTAVANETCGTIFRRQLPPNINMHWNHGDAHTVMAAADVILCASGTATLEAMLVNRPMVVAYRLAPLTFALAKRMVKVRWVSLPNLLADAPLVPEFLQDAAQPDSLGAALLHWLDHPTEVADVQRHFARLRLILDGGGSDKAAAAISALLVAKNAPVLDSAATE